MRRRKTAIFFLVLGICLSALALALNVGWILLSFREVVILVLGIVFFALIITGLVLNTIFLVREIRRNEQHDAFLNAVTHELKTPIASIKLYLDTLRTRDVSGSERTEFYDRMLAESDRLLRTVEQVLKAGSEREARRQRFVEPVDIGQVLANTIASVSHRYNLARDSIRFTEPQERFMVAADEDELQTAFLNLLDNAVKYSDGQPRISVRVSRNGIGRRVAVVVRDNGLGIPAEDLKRVFKRFYRVPDPASKGTKGTGLGLYIVRSIVERYGGKVSADSKGPGKGSTFMIQLPAA